MAWCLGMPRLFHGRGACHTRPPPLQRPGRRDSSASRHDPSQRTARRVPAVHRLLARRREPAAGHAAEDAAGRFAGRCQTLPRHARGDALSRAAGQRLAMEDAAVPRTRHRGGRPSLRRPADRRLARGRRAPRGARPRAAEGAPAHRHRRVDRRGPDLVRLRAAERPAGRRLAALPGDEHARDLGQGRRAAEPAVDDERLPGAHRARRPPRARAPEGDARAHRAGHRLAARRQAPRLGHVQGLAGAGARADRPAARQAGRRDPAARAVRPPARRHARRAPGRAARRGRRRAAGAGGAGLASNCARSSSTSCCPRARRTAR